jgi:hypothetical protein
MQAESQLLQLVKDLQQQLAVVMPRPQQEWYSVDQFAELVKREPFTVREWCRLGRIQARKKGSGRGRNQAWAIPHTELYRLERDGLLPIQRLNE